MGRSKKGRQNSFEGNKAMATMTDCGLENKADHPNTSDIGGRNMTSYTKVGGESIAIVTGGVRGIGEATVRLIVKNGAKVAIVDIEDTSGTILANELYTSAIYVHCDVSLEDDIKNLINQTISHYGRLDILFNNAGVLGNQSKNKSITNFDAREFDHIMRACQY
ncbi:unnamed protein product [Prunus armeniaca]|uniref:Uncharacterized protein n=1 Tax=Prunus armeniaca TaxID=36596 RepID=A0A6J5XN39_PRUAR|nr:unnamed protein product [Prunus armeniaca]